MFEITVLAQMSAPGGYINLIKLGVVLASFIAWTFGCQWVDRDTDVVKTKRERWNTIVLGAGSAGLAILFLLPWSGGAYFIGLGFWILLAAGGQLTYVVHRNSRVMPAQRILTFRHVQRLFAKDEGGEVAKLDRGQRIHLANHEGETVNRPIEREEAIQHDTTQEFLFDVLWRRASDADVLIGKDEARVIYRIDGVVSERSDVLNYEDAQRAFFYLKKLAGLNPEEIRRPQNGEIEAGLLVDAGDLERIRVITSGTTAGERLRLRVVKAASHKRLDELGINPQRLEKLREVIKQPTGLVLVSGLKGSGISTTQYAILREHDAYIQNVHILERKPLYDLDNITQVEFKTGTEGMIYARQLQSVLRREPDVVGVGECEDAETARISVRAAAENRKVYLAIEGKSSFDALSRLMAFTEDNKLVAKALLAVVNQRLIRILCPSCRQSFRPDEKLLRKANIPADKVEHFHRPPTEPVYDRKGREIICQTCQGSGYVDRTGIFEILFVDDAVRKLIAAGAPIKQIKAQARKNKMLYMDEEGLLKVIDGTTALDEVIRVLRDDKK